MSSDTSKVIRPPDSAAEIGLCLSGGGFRAALYGLGVVKYLAEADLLSRLTVVSAVSGGSVAAAVLADRWPELRRAGFSLQAFETAVEAPLHAALAATNVRNAAIGRWVTSRLSPWAASRGSAMGAVVAQRLLRATTVSDLDPGLQVLLTSTDLSSGRAFRVSQQFAGNYDYGYTSETGQLQLGRVVAASAAVPGLFPPQYLTTEGLGLKNAPAKLALVDGGVYDNLGLEWFQGWGSGRPETARRPGFLMVADASGPFQRTDKTLRGLKAVARTRDIQYVQTRNTRIRWLVERLEAGTWQGAYLAAAKGPRRYRLVNGTPVDPAYYSGSLPDEFTQALAGLRTDLDRFLPEESRLLSYHGYWSAHARLAALYPNLAVEPSWREYADLSDGEHARLLRMLERGRQRSVNRR